MTVEVRFHRDGVEHFALVGPVEGSDTRYAVLEYRGAGVFDEDAEPRGSNYRHTSITLGKWFAELVSR